MKGLKALGAAGDLSNPLLMDVRPELQANGHVKPPWRPSLMPLLPVLCCFLYAPCVTYSEWYIDELFAVLRNEDARGETSLAQVFSNDFWGNPLWGQSWTHKSYRPLAVLSFAWQFRFLGEDRVAAPAPGPAEMGVAECRALCSTPSARGVENIVYLVGRDLLRAVCDDRISIPRGFRRVLPRPWPSSQDYSFDAIPVLRAAWRDVRCLSVCAVGVTIGERLPVAPDRKSALGREENGDGALGHSLEKGRRSWPSRLGGVLLAIYVWRCGERVWQWRSSEALYMADAVSWPNSVKTRHQLGTVFHQQGRYDEALREFNASLMILDDNALTDHCVAQIYIETGRYQLALERFEKILQPWQAIGPLEKGLSRNAAVPHGQNALGLEYDPENPLIWSNLAVAPRWRVETDWHLVGIHIGFRDGLSGPSEEITILKGLEIA
eukprot:Skav200852  [mRNA]  locus=scaffold2484:74196:91601:+ [translate_table: standard]